MYRQLSSPERMPVWAAFARLVMIGITATSVCACVGNPPRIARGLPENYAQARPAFDQRVKERFPIGSTEAALVAELRRERFQIRETTQPRSATRDVGQLVCRRTYVVDWSASDGKIAGISGNY